MKSNSANSNAVTRRTFLSRSTRISTAILASATLAPRASATSPATSSSTTSKSKVAEASFLDDLQQRCYQFFLEAAHPETGLIADRARTDGSWVSPYSSVAGCGFSLVADAIAAHNDWKHSSLAEQRTERLLDTMLNRVEHQHGFFYHFIDSQNLNRAWPSEVSSIDTALFIAGAMVSANAFPDNANIVSLSHQLCDRVEWPWMLNGSNLFSMGWTPETGFLSPRWDRFSELPLLVLIAIGASTHHVPADCWRAWRRGDVIRYNGESYLNYPPLFVHQYPQAFFDFRNQISPSGRSYWMNSITAHHAHIDYLTKLGEYDPSTFGHYNADLWGVTSSDSELGYRDWGGPYRDGSIYPERGMDGTIAPAAAAGGLAIVPEEALRTLKYQHEQFGAQIYGRYGFANAYNPRTGWVGSDVIGIDTGISMIMAENCRSGRVWDWFMQHDVARAGLERAGFHQHTHDLASATP